MKSRISETHEDRNEWRREFKKKLEFAVLNKRIQERLKITQRAQLDWITPCFRKPNTDVIRDIRRRCFCESIGPKFCELCRRKVSKDLSKRVPKIICDLRSSKDELLLLERAEYFVTPEPRFSKHLKQASSFYKLKEFTQDEQCLSIENPKVDAASRTSSFSSVTSSDIGESPNDEIVPVPSPSSPNTSPLTHDLPSINCPKNSPDNLDYQCVRTSVPQLPEITCDPNVDTHQPTSPVTPDDKLKLVDIQQPITRDVQNDPHGSSNSSSHHHSLTDIPRSEEQSDDSDIHNDPQIFHITHQLRSIHELKADASNAKFPSNPNDQQVPTVTQEQLSNNFSQSQNEMSSTANEQSESSVSLKTDMKSDCDHFLPKLLHPVEPVLLELKYINFSIYDYDCNIDK